jgi:two-component system sensor histidine kinase/response regulator
LTDQISEKNGGSGGSEQALADLRHDLRTPIGHVLGYGEMVWDELQVLGQPALALDVEKIQAAGKHLLALVDERLTADALGLTGVSASLSGSFPVNATHAGSVISDAVPKLMESEQAGLLLIVDDNEDNRDVLARRLQKQGHWAVTASSGREALEALADQPYDLVLLDVMMPDMDGYEVLSFIKSDPRTQHVPVIMISALDEMDSVVRCIELGAADYLPKPFNPTLLGARIGASLREKRAHDRELRYTREIAENLRKLKELERLRDDLTHMIVHDLRTPLTSLMSGLQTVPLIGELNETQAEMLDIAVNGGETLLGMINDLLDVDKMEQESVPLEITMLTPVSLMERALSQVTLLAQASGLTLAALASSHLPPFSGDEDKLRRTLVNLLGNAIKFTPFGGTITAAAELQEDVLLFSIHDTGEGIPPEAFDRIFDKFGQVENRKAGRKMSTGLGLTFCKLAVEAHGGRIWVESRSGEGSAFYFTIPRHF